MKTIVMIMALFLMSCATSSSLVMLGKSRTPVNVADVKIYHQEPGVKYIKRAKIRASTSTGFTEQSRQESIINKVVEKAAKLGANAVIFQEPYFTPKPFSDAHVTIKGMAIYIK